MIQLLPLVISFAVSPCISNGPTKIISGLIMCLSFSFPFSFSHESITIFRELRIVVSILFFFIVFHCNPSFSVLGPTIVAGHEIMLKQVDVKGS
jgi:hypothetical protein